MSIWVFLFSVIVISMSGILMPGPITAFTVSKGSRNPWAGSLIAIGHVIVEIPLIALIYFGVGMLFQRTPIKVVIGILGGGVLLWMAIDMFRNYQRADILREDQGMNSLVAGIVLSAGNPYFLVWWATVGASLILRSIEFGMIGLLLMVVIHWSCDLVWHQFLSWLSFQGGRFFGKRLQMAVFIICGLAMLYFGLYFITDTIVRLV